MQDNLDEEITMLDYFAAQVISGAANEVQYSDSHKLFAKRAYKIAQAMIEERRNYVGV